MFILSVTGRKLSLLAAGSESLAVPMNL